MHGWSSCGRLFLGTVLIGVWLLAPQAQAAGKKGKKADAAGESNAASEPATSSTGESSSSEPAAVAASETVPITKPSSESSPPPEAVVPSAPPAEISGPTVTKSEAAPPAPTTTGEATAAASEAGVPGWFGQPGSNHSGIEWHGNLEMDVGHVGYTFGDSKTLKPETVYDWRGRVVFGPTVTHDLGDYLYVRIVGQAVGWIREFYNQYQVNVDDAYAQIGSKDGFWDLQAGRFLTWRVFRKGLGFDLYTLEDTGARFAQNFTEKGGFYNHAYEVNTIFLRDSGGVPPGRAAFHLYPTSWLGIEAVGTYGSLDSALNVLGGRLALGMKLPYINALGGVEYVKGYSTYSQSPDPCSTCGDQKILGGGGSIGLTPWRWIELVGDLATRKSDVWDPINNNHTTVKTTSFGGYAQFDILDIITNRYSLILGGGYFQTEYLSDDSPDHAHRDYQRHKQYDGYAVLPLGFNNAVVKVVYSQADGYREQNWDSATDGPKYFLNGTMKSLRFRFAFYY